jgi:hypothetical protein
MTKNLLLFVLALSILFCPLSFKQVQAQALTGTGNVNFAVTAEQSTSSGGSIFAKTRISFPSTVTWFEGVGLTTGMFFSGSGSGCTFEATFLGSDLKVIATETTKTKDFMMQYGLGTFISECPESTHSGVLSLFGSGTISKDKSGTITSINMTYDFYGGADSCLFEAPNSKFVFHNFP